MCFEELKEKALSLPQKPGVYLMKDKDDRVIYVGKAKKLKNRVCQYFQDTASHNTKTKRMVSKIDHFDVIVAASEFEALVLECNLIKRHMPKYNILLKDDKGYPYLRLDMREAYPVIAIVSKISDDGAGYFGPFGSRHMTAELLEAIRLALLLPNCSKKFPRDIGSSRPCLNYHMNQCSGWCQGTPDKEEYRRRFEQAKQLLSGNFKAVAEDIRKQMLVAADGMQFELAALLRDRLNAIEALGQKQLVVAGAQSDLDVIGYAQTEAKACFTVLHFRGGNLLDKDYEVFSAPESAEQAVSALLKQYYLSRGIAPKVVFLPFEIEDMSLFSQLMEEKSGRKTRFKVPQRGDNVRLVDLAVKNAAEEAERVTDKIERTNATLSLLGKMLAIPAPKRIESFDISNLYGTDIVASMVVFEEGKPHRSDYKRFKVEGMVQADDYGSMKQILQRRFSHFVAGDSGFEAAPDLLLIDGGMNHANIAVSVLQEHGLNFPVFGMVKDDRHRTRALVSPEGKEIRIDAQQAVFALIGNIQEETHRFAITYHRKLRSKRLRYSELDSIPGIGPKRKQQLLKTFGSITAMRNASIIELERLLPRSVASQLYRHFHDETEGEGTICE